MTKISSASFNNRVHGAGAAVSLNDTIAEIDDLKRAGRMGRQPLSLRNDKSDRSHSQRLWFVFAIGLGHQFSLSAEGVGCGERDFPPLCRSGTELCLRCIRAPDHDPQCHRGEIMKGAYSS